MLGRRLLVPGPAGQGSSRRCQPCSGSAHSSGKEGQPSHSFRHGAFLTVLWIRNYFFRIPIRIRIPFVRVLDPDPLWLIKSYGSSFGSDLNILSFTIPTIKKAISWHFKAYFFKKFFFYKWHTGKYQLAYSLIIFRWFLLRCIFCFGSGSNPQPQVTDPDSDPDPAKNLWSLRIQIRIRIHNTPF
jgi:hypothetical protein